LPYEFDFETYKQNIVGAEIYYPKEDGIELDDSDYREIFYKNNINEEIVGVVVLNEEQLNQILSELEQLEYLFCGPAFTGIMKGVMIKFITAEHIEVKHYLFGGAKACPPDGSIVRVKTEETYNKIVNKYLPTNIKKEID
jgi:hypothetical protein